ncbi:hypothetical protein BDF19DRAFT_453625 [Syncephalis fuscata]|nr:hypothetical protein BDF19DRAFT_453625 [Syncephalis fuscata]
MTRLTNALLLLLSVFVGVNVMQTVLAATPSTSAAVAAGPAPSSSNNNNVNTNSKDTASSFSKASDKCRKALLGSDVAPPCASIETIVPPGKSISMACAAPIDGASGHFCSMTQINKALDTMESECQEELKAAQGDVQSVYADWLMYSLDANTFCTKLPNGSYCMEAATSNNTQPTNDQNGQCSDCSRVMLENALKQKPPRSATLAGEKYTSKIDSFKQSAKECKIAVNAATSTRPLITSAGIIAVIGLLLFHF